MPRRLISSGSSFERDIGYSRAVVVGNQVFVSGTTGFDYSTMTISDDVATQAAQCLRNIEVALREAGASMQDVVRVRYILPHAADPSASCCGLSSLAGVHVFPRVNTHRLREQGAWTGMLPGRSWSRLVLR
jgi:enamine deaminase RidA (YjgF/YER057c/UK114 family)